MSERERQLVEMISRLPEKAQDTFLAQAQGAVIAIDALQAEREINEPDAPKEATA